MTPVGLPDPNELGAAAHALQNGQTSKSLTLLKRLAAKFPNNADIEHLMGLANRAAGQRTAALSHLEKAAALAPGNASILNNLGLVFLEGGEIERAVATLDLAIKANSQFAAAHANLGHAHLHGNNLRVAESCYREALHLNPGQADAASNLVQLLATQARLCDLTIDLNHPSLPLQPEILAARGLVAMDQGDFTQAEKLFERAISNSQGTPALLNNLALALAKQGRTEEALKTFHRVSDAAPQNPEPLINIADLLKYSRPEDAIPYVEKALELNPNDPKACDLLGFLHFMNGREAESIPYFDTALSIDPSFSRAIFHKAGAAFLTGDLDSAWESYLKRYGASLCVGSPLPDTIPGTTDVDNGTNRIAIWTDQGLGDEILQLSLVPDMYVRGHVGLLSVSERLVPIVKRTFPDVDVLSHEQARTLSAQQIRVAAQSPAMALGRAFRRTWESFPDRPSYLKADATRADAIRKKYQARNGGSPLVGISWKSTNTTFGAEKSLALPDMLDAFAALPCTWVNLQYGDVSQDIASIGAGVVVDPEIDPLTDMDAFAAQVLALDLVVTTSNTTAHMAGALGKPTVVLVPRRGPGWLWYWFDNRSDSPWYPTVTVLRQETSGDWRPALSAALYACQKILE